LKNLISKLVVKTGRLSASVVNSAHTAIPRIKKECQTQAQLYKIGYSSVRPSFKPKPIPAPKVDYAKQIIDEHNKKQ